MAITLERLTDRHQTKAVLPIVVLSTKKAYNVYIKKLKFMSIF